MTVKIVTDSTSYIDENTRKDLDIKTLNLSVHFPDGESYDEVSVSYDYFYNKIEKDNVIPTSSQPTFGQIYDVFKEIIIRGEKVLGIFLSSRMSGTYASALSAKKLLIEEYPNAIIEIVDSKTNCMAMGIQVIEAALAAKAGKRMEEVLATVYHIMKTVHFYFVPASLKYLIRGGRIGGASALIGSLLQIRPILYVNDGMTDVLQKVRGTKTAINKITEILSKDVKKLGMKHLLVHHINNAEQGQELANRLSKECNIDVPVFSIGPVIGLHVGPGTLGIVYTTEN